MTPPKVVCDECAQKEVHYIFDRTEKSTIRETRFRYPQILQSNRLAD